MRNNNNETFYGIDEFTTPLTDFSNVDIAFREKRGTVNTVYTVANDNMQTIKNTEPQRTETNNNKKEQFKQQIQKNEIIENKELKTQASSKNINIQPQEIATVVNTNYLLNFFFLFRKK